MCDCYTDRCKVCNEPHEMHLVDFETGQREVAVFCEEHMPNPPGDGVLWEHGPEEYEGPTVYISIPARKVYVQALTDNAVVYAGGNHPNRCSAHVVQAYGAVNLPKGYE